MRTRGEKMQRADAILTTDWHLTLRQPPCRTDNFVLTQKKKVRFIKKLSEKHNNCPVLIAGDLFADWKTSPELLNTFIPLLPKNIIAIYGNHDLPQRNINLKKKSGVALLNKINLIEIAKTGHYSLTGIDFDQLEPFEVKGRRVLLLHEMVYNVKTNRNIEGILSRNILRKLKDVDLVVTGHNHQCFTFEKNGRLLVNPGSLTRHKADQINHKPCVFLWFAKDNSIQKVNIPISKSAVSREHIEKEKANNEMLENFIQSLKETDYVDISFSDNLEQYINKNKKKIPLEVRKTIYRIMEEVK